MLSERLKTVMALRGMNQVELAKKAGLSQQMVSLIVNGKTPDPGVSKVIKICQALDVPFDLIVLEDIAIEDIKNHI